MNNSSLKNNGLPDGGVTDRIILLMFKSSYSLKPSGGLDHPGSEFPGRH